MNSIELLIAIKKHHGVESDYALARILKISRAALSDWRERGLSDERALQFATDLNLDPGPILAAIHAERSADPKVRKAWETIAKTMRSAAAAVLLVLGFGVTAPEPLQAAQLSPGYTLYEARLWRRFWLLWRSLAGGFARLAYTIALGETKNMTKGLAAVPLALLFAATASADVTWAIQVNGLSWHANQRDYNGEKFNGINTGIGVQITQPVIDQPNTFIHWTAGTLINSMDDRSWYAGTTVVRRWGEIWQFEAGLFFGAITYPSYENGWFIAPAPFLSFGTQHVGLNAIVLPPIGDLPAAALFQLRVGL